jgi:hypothetical protein
MLHNEILTPAQVALLPVIKTFSKQFGLVGGTAIAFYIGHRKSIDFDLFSHQGFDNNRLREKLAKQIKAFNPFINKKGEYTLITESGVKITFYNFPYKLKYIENFKNVIKLPDLLTLAAMKAFAIGQRSKWKDYVDLYFILRDYYSIDQINARGRELFDNEYNEKMFKAQLSYFNDLNYSEKIEFLPGFAVTDNKIKKALIEFSLS